MALGAKRSAAHRSILCATACVALPGAFLVLMMCRSREHWGAAPFPCRRHTGDRLAAIRRQWWTPRCILVRAAPRPRLRLRARPALEQRQKLADAGALRRSITIGKEAAMADALEAAAFCQFVRGGKTT
jgi:hypothetical protein